ncbi:MAG: trehalose-6-phosphate synthase, partial [Gammaproteobacteria bacterium]|nr:trehalose-6-phosphate synthase [Gammaproteobacteria bacterium]
MFRSAFARLILPVALACCVVAYIGLPYIDKLLTEWFLGDIELRAQLLMTSMRQPVSELVAHNDRTKLQHYLDQITADKRLLAIAVCRPDGGTVVRTELTPHAVSCELGPMTKRAAERTVDLASGTVEISRFDFDSARVPYRVLLVHDLSFVDRRQRTARDFLFLFVGIAVVLLAIFVVLGAWLQLRRWVNVLIGDIRGGRFGDDAKSSRVTLPILSQVRDALAEIEETQRLEIDFRENWTPRALRQVVVNHLHSAQVLTVSNREPYVHNRDAEGRVVVQFPASGMVTAIEPIMRACSGVWIAHGSGSADRDAVDRYDHVPVPPEDPEYTLRRVWLTREEEEGYYYGFSNEGLWPLCHLAYVRPEFRAADWRAYEAVNAKFAAACVAEATTDSPVILLQDFHVGLLPKLIRAKMPKATIVLFWHIPWPNAETFGVCPWKRDLLLHMLSADILGFHTRYHCHNFLESVDRFVECRIDREHMTVTLQGHVCKVAPYPISIEWPPRWLKALPDIAGCRQEVRERYGIGANVFVAVGVERWDFTKGIVERLHALEILLDRNPRQRGRVCLLQVAAPSRSRLPAYQALQRQTLEEVERINAKFEEPGWKPIVLIGEHQEPQRVFELYRAADACLVNSLHDGMNLVAKEFVASRDDEDGVLILSTFAGASRELTEAMLVNPFDVTETADALEAAIRMDR